MFFNMFYKKQDRLYDLENVRRFQIDMRETLFHKINLWLMLSNSQYQQNSNEQKVSTILFFPKIFANGPFQINWNLIFYKIRAAQPQHFTNIFLCPTFRQNMQILITQNLLHSILISHKKFMITSST